MHDVLPGLGAVVPSPFLQPHSLTLMISLTGPIGPDINITTDVGLIIRPTNFEVSEQEFRLKSPCIE